MKKILSRSASEAIVRLKDVFGRSRSRRSQEEVLEG